MTEAKRSTTEREREIARYNWLTVTEAAARLGDVDNEQVFAWVDGGQLRAFEASKPGAERRDLRFKPEWLDAFEASRTINPAANAA